MTFADVDDAIPEGCDYRLITTEEELDRLCADMASADMLAVDTETEGLSHDDIIVGLCVSTGPNMGCYIPIRHEVVEGVRDENQLDPTLVFAKLGPLLEEKPCTGHNTKFDLKMFWKEGVDCNFVHDTLIQSHLIAAYGKGERGLKQLVKRHFEHNMASLESLFPPPSGKKKVKVEPAKLRPEDIFVYGAEDADFSFRLYNTLTPVMKSRVPDVLYKVEMKLLRVVAEMEMWGVPVDQEFLHKSVKEITDIVTRLNEELHDEIREVAGDEDLVLNFNSYPQLRKVLYEYLEMPVVHLTPKGDPSTAGHVLEEMAKDHHIVNRILTYRHLLKLRSFMEKMINEVQEDGRIRGNFNQAGTESGRFSSSNPNLQQIPKDQTFVLWPIEDEDRETVLSHFSHALEKQDDGSWLAFNRASDLWESKNVYLGHHDGLNKGFGVYAGRLYEMRKYKTRKFIAAAEGDYVIEADYSQIELRIMAGESQEPTLVDAYEKGDDVHGRTAAVIFDVDFNNVTKEQRSVGKTINFGLLYGAGPQRISQELNISVAEAKSIVNKYFENLPAILTWINRMKSTAKADKLSRTRLGRIRQFPNISSSDGGLRAREEREAVNHIIQGSAADVMKFALVRASRDLRKSFGDRVKIICTVHDSLMLECDKSCDPAEVVSVLKHSMEDFTLYDKWPDLLIDVAIGPSWGDTNEEEFEDLLSQEDFPEADESSLPKVRVPLIGRVREGHPDKYEDYFIYQDYTPEDEEPVAAEYTEVGEEDWVLELSHSVTRPALNKFVEWAGDKVVEDGSSLTLKYTDEDDKLQSIYMDGPFNIRLEDKHSFALIFGPCKLYQNLESIDPLAVTEKIDFESVT
ncbi:MAG: DNA polymerase [Candidatus Bathyarchaeota archaeon]|nr:DNA polymerase [Candidatus Bathyarchaeota archaeon]